MEETKTVKMEVNKAPEKERMSYEELNNIAHQLSEQNRQFYTENQKLKEILNSRRLDYLFAVLKQTDKFDTTFVTECVKEIQESLTIPEEIKEKMKNAESTETK